MFTDLGVGEGASANLAHKSSRLQRISRSSFSRRCPQLLKVLRPLPKLRRERRELSTMLLQIGAEIRTLVQGEPDPFELKVRNDIFLRFVLAYAKADLELTRSIRGDNIRVYDHIVLAANDGVGQPRASRRRGEQSRQRSPGHAGSFCHQES